VTEDGGWLVGGWGAAWVRGAGREGGVVVEDGAEREGDDDEAEENVGRWHRHCLVGGIRLSRG